MVKEYDVLIFMIGVNMSVINNYLNIVDQCIQHDVSCCIVFDASTSWGVEIDALRKIFNNPLNIVGFNRIKEHVYYCKTYNESINLLDRLNYKVGAISSNYYKFTNMTSHIPVMKRKSKHLVQLPDHGLDYYYVPSATDFCLVSKYFDNTTLMQSLFDRIKDRDRDKCVSYVGCINWDRVDTFLPRYYTRAEFCKRYNLDESKPIIGWAPSNVSRLGGNNQPEPISAYREVTKQPNVVIKIHPMEYKKRKSHKLNNRYSYEVFSSRNDVAILEQTDHYWWMLYCDVIFSHSSTISFSTCSYNTPVTYLNKHSEENIFFHNDIPNVLKGAFDYAGSDCKIEDISSHIQNEDFKIKSSEYERVKNQQFAGLDSQFFYLNFLNFIKNKLK